MTSFFRDEEVFRHLQQHVVPAIFDAKVPLDSIRAWCVGCATGEEAYSVAMLMLEEAARRDSPPHLQIFASDLHEQSLRSAREGIFTGDIATDVSEERLRRFFVKENGAYRVRKEVRDAVVFAPHNLLTDPPFSRLDLVVCRNLLIYLQRDVQPDVIELFHYALRNEGWLVLGSAETVENGELFATVDKQLSVYRKRNRPVPELRLPVFPIVRTPGSRLLERVDQMDTYVSYGALHQRSVERYAPPSLLLNRELKAVHLSEHAGRYLTHRGGLPTTSILKIIREELQIELQAAIQAAGSSRRLVRGRPVHLTVDGRPSTVIVSVRPDEAEEGYLLVFFEEYDDAEWPAGDGVASEPTAAQDRRHRERDAELEITRQRLQRVIEEYESSQEEMRASNEELQSTNEELRSTMEELQTVNQENRHKVAELSQLSSDLQSLMDATHIATLFLDRELRILRFTPQVTELFNVRASDRGRPLSDFSHRLGYDSLLQDVEGVLRDLVPVEREVEDEHGRWYIARLRPYRSQDDRIEGVVLTFVDFTERHRSEAALQASEARFRNLNATLEARVAERTREVRVLAAKLAVAEQNERRRIARMLHDDLQQLLYGMQMKMAALRESLPAQNADLVSRFDQIREWTHQAFDTTRKLTVELSPPTLRSESMAENLNWLQDHMREMYGLRVKAAAAEAPAVADEALRTQLLLIARELLFNVVKHAGTDAATLDFRADGDAWELKVSDGGRGFDPEAPAAGQGLINLRERLRFVGGRLDIASQPGRGTVVTVRVPRSSP